MLEFGFESFVLSQNIVVPLESVMLLLDVRQSENVPRCCKRLDFFLFSSRMHSTVEKTSPERWQTFVIEIQIWGYVEIGSVGFAMGQLFRSKFDWTSDMSLC